VDRLRAVASVVADEQPGVKPAAAHPLDTPGGERPPAG